MSHLSKIRFLSPPPAASRAFVRACAARAVSGQPRRYTCPCRSRLNVLNPFILSFIQLNIQLTIGDLLLLNPTFNTHFQQPLDMVSKEHENQSIIYCQNQHDDTTLTNRCPVRIAQLIRTMHNICKVWGSNPGHHKKKTNK